MSFRAGAWFLVPFVQCAIDACEIALISTCQNHNIDKRMIERTGKFHGF